MIEDFYPRSPCGERRRLRAVQNTKIDISIHALLAESDGTESMQDRPKEKFLSTLSLRRATSPRVTMSTWQKVFLSTLSLRRATIKISFLFRLPKNFYPRSPCGERPNADWRWPEYFNISIHALLAESDLTIMLYDTSSLIFLSTLSLRRATLATW